MQRAWLTTFGAALCAASASIHSPAAASPSGMTLGVRPVATSRSSDTSWTDKLQFWKDDEPTVARVATPIQPTESVSPWRHPITYFSTAMSEMPGASVFKGDKKEVAKAPDKLSLETPIAPATPQYYIALAQMAERQGQPAQARTQLQQALAKWPRDVDLLRAAARLEDRQGNLPTAEMLYHRAVAANSQHTGAHNDLGLCLARQGKLDQSVQSLEQAISLQPEKALYRNNVATVLVEMRQDQRALAHLSAVHGSAEANFNIGQLLADRGRPHEAYAYFQQALALDPSMQSAQDAIARMNREPTTNGQYAAEPAATPQAITPTYGPQQVSPEQHSGELSFPATARGPALNSSSYVPPGYYYPSSQPGPQAIAPTAQVYQPVSPMQSQPSQAAQRPVYQTATAPRYLPPVQQAPAQTMVR